MSSITLHFDKLKQRFAHLNPDVLIAFYNNTEKLTEVFSEALENFLLANILKHRGKACL